MKYLFLCLFLIPAICFSQSKGDTKIIVKASDTANLFNRVVSYLYEQGYSLERKDEVAGFLQTDEREMKKYTAFYKIKALVKDGTITFTSVMKLPTMEKTFSDVSWTKGDSFYRRVWNIVDEIARQFGAVSYSR
jgi:hypothetical protein